MQQNPIRRDGTRVAYGAPTAESALATNKVLRSTYMLLSMTLLFSAAMAGVSMALKLPYFGPFITLGVYFGLLFLTSKMKNSAGGIVCVFALTGFMGLTLGPLLSAYIQNIPNGGELVMTALATTGVVFLAISAYAVKSQKDFSFMGGFIAALADGRELEDAVLRGSACASMVVARVGCAPAMPTTAELDAFMASHPGPTLS